MLGIDQPMMAPSMHIQKPYKGQFSQLSFCQKLFFLKQTPSCICSISFYIVVTKYQIAQSKAVVEVDRPIKALSMHIQKPYN